MVPFIIFGDDYLQIKYRFCNSGNKILLQEKPAVNIWPLLCTKILLSAREALLFHGLY